MSLPAQHMTLFAGLVQLLRSGEHLKLGPSRAAFSSELSSAAVSRLINLALERSIYCIYAYSLQRAIAEKH